jgi:hypothetical protein
MAPQKNIWSFVVVRGWLERLIDSQLLGRPVPSAFELILSQESITKEYQGLQNPHPKALIMKTPTQT